MIQWGDNSHIARDLTDLKPKFPLFRQFLLYSVDMSKEYYYIDINLQTMAIVAWGTTPNATHTGKTEDPAVHRVFLTKGQFNKLVKHLN